MKRFEIVLMNMNQYYLWDSALDKGVGDGKGGMVTSTDFDLHEVCEEMNRRVGA